MMVALDFYGSHCNEPLNKNCSNCTVRCTPMQDCTTRYVKKQPCWITFWNCWLSIDHSVNRADRFRVRLGRYRLADSPYLSSQLPIARTATRPMHLLRSPLTSIVPYATMMIVSPPVNQSFWQTSRLCSNSRCERQYQFEALCNQFFLRSLKYRDRNNFKKHLCWVSWKQYLFHMKCQTEIRVAVNSFHTCIKSTMSQNHLRIFEQSVIEFWIRILLYFSHSVFCKAT